LLFIDIRCVLCVRILEGNNLDVLCITRPNVRI